MKGLNFLNYQNKLTFTLLICLGLNSQLMVESLFPSSNDYLEQTSFSSIINPQDSGIYSLNPVGNCKASQPTEENLKTTYYPEYSSSENNENTGNSQKGYQLGTSKRNSGTNLGLNVKSVIYTCTDSNGQETQKVSLEMTATSFGEQNGRRTRKPRRAWDRGDKSLSVTEAAAPAQICLDCVKGEGIFEIAAGLNPQEISAAINEAANELYLGEVIYQLDDQIAEAELLKKAKLAEYNCQGFIDNPGKSNAEFISFRYNLEKYSEKMHSCFEGRLGSLEDDEKKITFYENYVEGYLNSLAKGNFKDRKAAINLIGGDYDEDTGSRNEGLRTILDLPKSIAKSLDSMNYYSHHKNQIETAYGKFERAIEDANLVKDSRKREQLITAATRQYNISMYEINKTAESDINSFAQNNNTKSTDPEFTEWKEMLTKHYQQRADLANRIADNNVYNDSNPDTSDNSSRDGRQVYDNSYLSNASSSKGYNRDGVDSSYLDERNGASLAEFSNPRDRRKNI